MANLRDAVVALRGATTVQWKRLGDELPEICEPILLAHWSEVDGTWRVRDARLYIRYEEVTPSLADLCAERLPTDWWFDSVYPGKGDMRLATPDLLWSPMPTPEPPK